MSFEYFGNDRRDYRELYVNLIENLEDYAVFLIDASGRIASWNTGVERCLGYKESEFIGQPVDIVFVEEDIAAGVPAREMERAAAQRKAPDNRWHRRKDGSRLYVEGIMMSLRSPEGELLGYTKIMRDATAERVAEQEREQLLDRLRQSNEDLAHFAHMVAHDLQEPLRTVGIYAQLLKKNYEGRLGPDADEFVNYIVNGALQMSALLRDLLAYSEIDRAADLPTEPADANAVLDQAEENLQASILESGAAIKREPIPPLKVKDTHLLQLFQNLLSNSIKYRREEPPSIRISSVAQGARQLISVQDNGIGIDPKYAEKIFAPFQRLHTKEAGGTGVGLAICRRIVERYGGRIWVESTPGKGSTFYFTLPA